MSERLYTSGPIRVLLADDHTMFRQSLAGILASHSGIEVVAEVPNDADALELARDLEPDVVIMQVQLPVQRAVATLKAMRAFPHPPKVVIVTMFERPRYIRELTGVGASAYLLKTSSADHLVAVIRAAVFDPGSENTVRPAAPTTCPRLVLAWWSKRLLTASTSANSSVRAGAT